MVRRNAFKAMVPLALIVPGVALADVKAGVDAWSRGDYALAIREWQAPAERGDPDALYNLGQAYRLGRGVKADLAKAEEMFGRAAAKGHLQAADIYGLLLFQRGERQRAIPYVTAAAERGDPRAQYLLGVAHFNGDGVPKDWVKAYALASLAQQAGVAQAKGALAQMDRFIPLEQRQQAAALAPELASRAQATRARQLAAADLGVSLPARAAAPATMTPSPAPAAPPAARPAKPDTAERAARVATVAADDTPRTAGADYARPQLAPRAPMSAPSSRPAQAIAVARRPKASVSAESIPHHTRGHGWEATKSGMAETIGGWAVQLGAFAQAGNADALWNRVQGRKELADTARRDIRAGAVTKLSAAGFRTREEAAAACERLAAAKISCIVVRN